jgi:hypothetical protein
MLVILPINADVVAPPTAQYVADQFVTDLQTAGSRSRATT